MSAFGHLEELRMISFEFVTKWRTLQIECENIFFHADIKTVLSLSGEV